MTLNLDGGDDDFDTLLPECQESILDQPIAVTWFKSRFDTEKDERQTTLRELDAAIPQVQKRKKRDLPAIKLARFGNQRTGGDEDRALRNDGNVLAVSGVEGEHDGGTITIDEAESRIRAAGLAALLVSTSSHQPDDPHWRIFLPLSCEADPIERAKFAARVNGIFDGALDQHATFTLSQLQHIGAVTGGHPIETRLIDGRAVDLAGDLDATSLSKGNRRKADGSTAALPTDEDGLLAMIASGESYHPATTSLAGRWAKSGEALEASIERIRVAMLQLPEDQRDPRWRDRFKAIPSTVTDIFEREAKRQRDEFDDVEDLPPEPQKDTVVPAKEAALPLINPASWANVDVPERQWALPGWIPQGQATYLTGPGSAGKSLLSQQLATCIALGLPFLGIETTPANALYLTCEDDADELHRRQKAICDSLGVSVDQLSGRLFLASLAGDANTELCTFDDKGRLKATSRNASLKQAALSNAITFMALDNTAHLFSGNENVRHDVAAFVSLLNRLAMDIGGAVLFLGHPNKAGDSFSGSTAWENQVRSRLFLETPKEEDGSVVDRDCRVLSRQKANYARNGETISFRWREWAFVNDFDLPWSESAAGRDAAADEVFLRCLDKGNADGRTFSPSSPAHNYAPRSFVKMATASGITIKGFEAAMNRLLDAGVIKNEQPIYKRANRTWATGLGRVPDAFE